ncbi:MAG: sigma-70 family RNA polymerase sigma factor [Clostridia bacterium]|nr:sigma-70 family RNA polymerase sigma factor [Clostridia bacterium]
MIDYENQSDEALIRSAQEGDRQAAEEMTLRHEALVRYVARRFAGRGRDMEDLYQLGRLGLHKAVINFNTGYAVRFSTYAVPLIMGEIRRFLRDDGQVHISRSIRENSVRIAKLMEECGEHMPVSEMAEKLGLSREETVLAMEAGRSVRSLSEPLGDDGGILLQDTIGEDRTNDVVDRIALKEMLEQLPPFERELINRRYFLEQTQTSIAKELGMTQVQISRLESRIIKRLREIAG